jgi:hypothetical protein
MGIRSKDQEPALFTCSSEQIGWTDYNVLLTSCGGPKCQTRLQIQLGFLPISFGQYQTTGNLPNMGESLADLP